MTEAVLEHAVHLLQRAHAARAGALAAQRLHGPVVPGMGTIRISEKVSDGIGSENESPVSNLISSNFMSD